jgi:putative thiamine transport system ATP-binding protein
MPPHTLNNPMSLHIQIHQLASPKAVLLRDLELNIPKGVIHTVMGESGSGKSSLLGAIAGTLADDFEFDGLVTLNGRALVNLPTEQRQVGLLFQDSLLFAHMNVQENLLFAVPPGPKAARLAKVTQALLDAELAGFAQADPATLSGGQRARVALMRALLAQPQALLLDEPFAKLDTAMRARLREFVFATVRNRAIPVLMVTHDAADVADTQHLTHLAPPDA